MARKKEEKPKRVTATEVENKKAMAKGAVEIVAEISLKAIPVTQINTDFQKSYEAGYRDALKAVAAACD